MNLRRMKNWMGLFVLLLPLVSSVGVVQASATAYTPWDPNPQPQTLLWVESSRAMQCSVGSKPSSQTDNCVKTDYSHSRHALVQQGLRDWVLSQPDSAAVGLGSFSAAGAQVLSPVLPLGSTRAWSSQAVSVMSDPRHSISLPEGKRHFYFPNLQVPPGAVIERAALVLAPKATVVEPQNFTLAVARNAEQFLRNLQHPEFHDLERSHAVRLPILTEANTPQEIDLTAALRAHLRSGRDPWCFGQGLGVMLRPTTASADKIVFNDLDDDPQLAPRLIVQYRAGPRGKACAVSERIAYVRKPTDDGYLGEHYEEYPKASRLALQANLPVGLGFRAIDFTPVPGQRLERATLSISAASVLAAGTQLLISARHVPQEAGLPLVLREWFTKADAGQSVRWTLAEAVPVGARAESPDLATVLAPIFSAPNWRTGDGVVFQIRANQSAGAIRAASPGASGAAKLYFRWRGQQPIKTLQSHRYRLLAEIARLPQAGEAATDFGLSEAERYWLGQPAQLGLQRAPLASEPAMAEAHLQSLSDMAVFRHKPMADFPSQCLGLDLRKPACATHQWLGRPVYNPPARQGCKARRTALISAGDGVIGQTRAFRRLVEQEVSVNWMRLPSALQAEWVGDGSGQDVPGREAVLREVVSVDALVSGLQQLPLGLGGVPASSMDLASVPVTSVPVTVKLPKTRRLITYEGELQQRGYAWVPDGDLQGKLKLLVKTEPQSKRSDSGQLGGDLDQAPSLATPNSLGSFVGTETLRVSYDNRAGKSQATVFASSNQGFLHAFDDKTGQELFTFMPQVLLSEQSARQDSFAHRAQLGVPASLAHGKGSSWIAWRHDALQQPAEVSGSYWRRDGVITPSSAVLADSSSPEAGDRDFVMLYGVMGREGRNLYALDATNSIAPNRDTLPRLRFVIRGGEPGPYARLGQTWSTPVLTQMRFQGKVRPVLVFGGGYDATVFDELPKSGQALPGATLGNAVYVVDALSGALLWWTSQANGSAVHPDLKYSVPMSVKPLDLTGDGVTDRLYFGDIFGQVFRVQFDTSGNGDVVKIADLGEEHSQLPNATKPLFTHRLFFNAPSVATVRQGDGRLAVAVALGSGNLSAPLAKVAQDRLFVMYDPVDLAQTGASMVVTPAELAVLNLERNTTVPLQAGGRGWQMPLNDRAGEKIMVSPMIFAGQLFFASWSPHSPSSVAPKTCAMPGPHQGHLYSLSLVDGSPTAFFAGQPFESFHLNGISPRIQLVAQADALALVYGTRVFPFPDATPLATAVAASPAKQASLIKQASGGTLIGAGGLRRTEWRRLR